MADEQVTSTVDAGATTPAASESVEVTESTPAATENAPATEDAFSNPWDDMVQEADQPDTPEPAKAGEETPAEPAKEPETDDKSKEDEAKPLEDQVLEELFADDAETDAGESSGEKDTDKAEKADGEKDEIDSQDPEEMAAAQRNATAKEYLKRAERAYIPLKKFKYGEIKPDELQSQIAEFIGDDRAAEYSQYEAHRLVDANPDATFQRAYAVKMLKQNPNWDPATAKIPTLDELIAGQASTGTPAEQTPATSSSDPSELSKELDAHFDWDWRNPDLDSNFLDDREVALAKAARTAEAQRSALEKQFEDLKKDVGQLKETSVTAEQQEFQKELTQTVNEFRTKVEEKVLPYIAKNTGLEVTKEDTPKVAAFKQQQMLNYTGTDYERENNLPSRFESFAYNESSVRSQLETLTTRLVDVQAKEVQARRAGNTAEATKLRSLAEAEQIPMFKLLAAANKEFKAKFIAPQLDLLEDLSNRVAQPIKQASARVEVVSNGAGTGAIPPKPKEYESAEDVWGSMIEESAEEDMLRANA